MPSKTRLYILVMICLVWAVNATALEVSIIGDKISIQADKTPLQNVLRAIMDLGINVRIDPTLNHKVTASFINRDMQDGLASILKPYSHIFIWKSLGGPVGPLPLLSEIQVFEPGKKTQMKRLKKRPVLDITQDPLDGSFYVRNEILLRLKSSTSLASFYRILSDIRGSIIDSNIALGIYRIRLPDDTDIPALVEEIARLDIIKEAEPNFAYPIDRPYHPASPYDSPGVASTGIQLQNAAPIAILDSGLDPNVDLSGKVLASSDVFNPGETISDPLGHGTQMAYIASGIIQPSNTDTGPGNNIPIIPIRVFDDNGYTSDFAIMNAIDFALDHGAKVMSLSWGSETRSDFLENSLEYAHSRGITILASAGNAPTGTPVYPAAYPTVIGVGALTPDGRAWDRSNYGDFVTLYAPGFASFPVGYKGDPGNYAGTSISAAFAANQIASYFSRNPGATQEEIRNMLKGIEND